MDFELQGKVAVVGGGSMGIGFAIARDLAREGAKVLIWARRRDELERAASAIRQETSAEVHSASADIGSAEDNLRVIDTAVAAFGHIDILVNNDGSPPQGPLARHTDEAWQKAIQQNLMSVVRMCGAALPHMARRGGGRIINITALSVLQPSAGFGLSTATWAGLIGYSKTLSLEAAGSGTTVNTICPGRIDTPLSRRLFVRAAKGDPEKEAALTQDAIRRIPLGRLGVAEDISSLVVLLASARGSYITGLTIPVDGGRYASLY